MGKISAYCCDMCKKLLGDEEGFILRGLLLATTNNGIGRIIIHPSGSETSVDVSYCRSCFAEILGVKTVSEYKKIPDDTRYE